ncbi:MAG: FMN-dependent NADH-azoreductase [Nitrospirae bacterium]|nr:MAG: FMN-dependent NADH-azoreductase [Nitrospirota bacterium]
MGTVLYIEASPRKDRSHSSSVARAFLEAYRLSHAEDRVETLDLWATDLPAFDGTMLEAKYRILHGETHTPEEAQAWERVTSMFRTFQSADIYVFSVPMWNFGIPYRLKHYIDIITQPGLAFRFSPDTGYQGLVTGKPAIVIYASGGTYGEGSGTESFDMQKPYMKLWLTFIGFTTIHSLVVEGTLLGPEARAKSLEHAITQAKQLAATM